MSYCNTHGRYDGDGCPACRDVENEIIDSLARSREDLATAAAHIAHAENNPGDYVCPSCMFQTLKKGASRCPKCHADPGRQYWADVAASERAREIAAAAEWERGRPAREAEEAAREAKEAKDRFRKTYVPLIAACFGFIGSFNNSSISGFLAGAFFAGLIAYAFAKQFVKFFFNKGIDIFKFPPVLIQVAAAGVVILTIISHSGGGSALSGGFKSAEALRTEAPEIQQAVRPTPNTSAQKQCIQFNNQTLCE